MLYTINFTALALKNSLKCAYLRFTGTWSTNNNNLELRALIRHIVSKFQYPSSYSLRVIAVHTNTNGFNNFSAYTEPAYIFCELGNVLCSLSHKFFIGTSTLHPSTGYKIQGSETRRTCVIAFSGNNTLRCLLLYFLHVIVIVNCTVTL